MRHLIIDNYADPDSVIRRERLKIPYTVFSHNPIKTVKALLGRDAAIYKIERNGIITDDECYIVDVEYANIKFSPIEVLFIDAAEFKPVIPNGNVYAVKINGCGVQITSDRISEFKNKIPISVQPQMDHSYTKAGQLPELFSYFGTIVRRPMHGLCTPLKHPGHQFTPFRIPMIPKLYPEGYKLKKPLTMEQTKEAYQAEMSTVQQLKKVDNIVIAKGFGDCKLGTTAYVIPFGELPKDRYLNGIILIQPKRIPNVVLFYPTITFVIYPEELESIQRFLEIDEINALNYEYAMGE